MRYIAVFLLLFVIGCKKKEGLELEIVTKELFCTKEFKQKSFKNIVTYKLTNNDNVTYYFNNYSSKDTLKNNYKFTNYEKSFFQFIDSKGKIPKYSFILHCLPTEDGISYENIKKEKDSIKINNLKYNINPDIKEFIDKNNFIIHPNETLYFEYVLELPNPEIDNSNLVIFNLNEKYLGQLIIRSDSTNNYKKYISRTDLKTIEENGYEVYNGIIKSKNKIPVKFVNP